MEKQAWQKFEEKRLQIQREEQVKPAFTILSVLFVLMVLAVLTANLILS